LPCVELNSDVRTDATAESFRRQNPFCPSDLPVKIWGLQLPVRRREET